MSRIMCSVAWILLCLSWQGVARAQNPPTAQIQRSQEMMEQDRILREKVEKDKKVYIKEIIVRGSALPDSKIIEEITASFKKHWLSKEDIESLIGLIKDACVKNGQSSKPPKITYRIHKNTLKIQTER